MDPATTDAYPTFFDRSTPARRHLGRRGWIAGALSFLLCGLGQLYAGRWRQALAFFLADLLVFLACLLAFLHVRIEPLNLYLPLSAYLAYRVWVIVNAVRTARRAKGFRWRWFARWFAYVTLFGCYS